MSATLHCTEGSEERAAFEDWAGTLQSWIPNVERIHPSGPYKSLVTASAWSAWKARGARASQIGEVGPTEAEIDALWVKAENTGLGYMAAHLRAREFARLLLAGSTPPAPNQGEAS